MVKKLFFVSLLAAAGLWGDGLSLTIGNPIAAEVTAKTKFVALFAVRVNGCADAAKAQVTAMGHGTEENERRSVDAKPLATVTPGVYVIGRQWLPGSKWVVAVNAVCGNETAGAIVPVTDNSFIRERIQMFSHAPTPAEIETALKAR